MRCEGSSTAGDTIHTFNWNDKRATIIDRDGMECLNCGQPVSLHKHDTLETANVHHITGVSEGGRDIPRNLATLCGTCHTHCHKRVPEPLHLPGLSGEKWFHESVLFTDSMVDMLDFYDELPCTFISVGQIVEVGDWPREFIKANMKQLMEKKLAVKRDGTRGVYDLTKDPREDSDGG